MGHRISIVDDHPLLAEGLRRDLVRSGATIELIDPEPGPESILAALDASPPDAVVLDLGLPFTGGGAALIGPIVERSLPVMILTGETDSGLLATAVGLGAVAVVSKAEPLPEIVDTILRVAAGEPVRGHQRAELEAELRRLTAREGERLAPFARLTPRETQVLGGLIEGQSPQALAERDFVSIATVRTQIKSLLRKLGVGSQLEAVALANRNGWRPDDGSAGPAEVPSEHR